MFDRIQIPSDMVTVVSIRRKFMNTSHMGISNAAEEMPPELP